MKKTIIFALAIAVLNFSTCFAEEKKGTEEKKKAKPLIGNTKVEEGVKKVLETLIKPMDDLVGSTLKLETIVVTPSKVEEKFGAQSSSVSVIREEEFEKRKIHYVKDALKNEMGLDVVESGAFTGQTSVFIRGADSNKTLVMIDGVRAYDPISPNAAFNFAHLTLDNVEQIEIVRGPQSTLYGSDAMGGVINVITKKPEEPFFNASFETGSFSTFRETFSMGAETRGLHYSIGGSNVKSRGISSKQAKNNNPELDGYERYALSARADYDFNENFTVGSIFRYTHALFDIDGFGGDDPNAHQKYDQAIFTCYVDHKPFDFYSYYIKLGWMHTLRQDIDANNGNEQDYGRDWYKGYLFSLDYRNNIHLFDIDTFTIGYDYTEEMGDSYYYTESVYFGTLYTTESDMPKVFSRNSSLYLQNRLNLSDRLTSTQGIRIDYHSQAGTHITYKLDGSYLLPTGTKLRGGWATGFKAPTLYQLNAPAVQYMSEGGNSELKPETSQSYEMGIDQYLFGEKALVYLTYFHTMFKNLIDSRYNPATYMSEKYKNIDKAHSHGIESGGSLKPLENLEIRGAYTYNVTEDYNTGTYLLRRPRHKFKINTFWEIVPNWDMEVGVTYVGLRLDSGNDKLKPYTVVDFNTSYKIMKNLKIYVKIDNLLNKRYEEVRGYGTSPFAVYAGAKGEF